MAKSLFLRVLHPSTSMSHILLWASVIAFLVLGYFDYLQPIKDVLDDDNFAFTISNHRFSVYLLAEALFLIILLFWLAGSVAGFAENRIKKIERVKPSNRALIIKTIQIMVYFAAATAGLKVLGFDLTTLTVFSGAVGIGIGFGLQKITSNFISGIILLFEKSIEDGDLVELNGEIFGFVRHTKARYTLIESHDGREIMIPNEDFMTTRVTNWTYSNKKGRIEFMVGVGYSSDTEKARELMLDAARSHPRTINDPEPVCFLREFGDNSVNFLLQFWVEDVTAGRYEPQSDVMRAIMLRFKENNIEIPFPQRDLHIRSGTLNVEGTMSGKKPDTTGDTP